MADRGVSPPCAFSRQSIYILLEILMINRRKRIKLFLFFHKKPSLDSQARYLK